MKKQKHYLNSLSVKTGEYQVQAFHGRRLGDVYRLLYLDGLWIKISRPVKAKKALLVAYGIRHDGKRELLDFLLAPSESEASCPTDPSEWGFLLNLKDRGIHGNSLQVIIHDGCGALIKAVMALYPRVRRHWCVFHKLQDISGHLLDRRHRSQIAKDAAAIYEAETEKELRDRLRFFQATWHQREPQAVRCFMRRFDETLTYREYQEPLKTLIKTNNPIERQLEELQRRIKPFPADPSDRKFVNDPSVERIVYGLIAYVSYGSAGLDAQLGKKTRHFTQLTLHDHNAKTERNLLHSGCGRLYYRCSQRTSDLLENGFFGKT